MVPTWAQTVFFRVDTTGATNDTMFNVILTYQLSDGTSTDGYGNNLTYAFTTCYNAANGTSQDVPAGISGFDVTGAIPAGATINRIDYFVSGGYQRGITFNDVSLVVSKEANDKTLSVDSETTMLMPGYTAYVIEHTAPAITAKAAASSAPAAVLLAPCLWAERLRLSLPTMTAMLSPIKRFLPLPDPPTDLF